MADLRTNYVDDILDTSTNERRKYRMITNDDGTVSFVDVTDYSQIGDSFGSSDLNAITNAVNENTSSIGQINDSLEWKLLVDTIPTANTQSFDFDFTPYNELLVMFSCIPVEGSSLITHTIHVLVSELTETGTSYQVGSYKDETNNLFFRISLRSNKYSWATPAFYCGENITTSTTIKIYGR